MFWWIIISAPFLLLLLALCLPITITLRLNSEPNLVIEGQARWVLWQIKQLRYTPTVPTAPTSITSLVKPSERGRATPKEQPPTAKQQSAAAHHPRAEAKKQDRIRLPWATVRLLVQKYLPRCWRALHLRCAHGDLRLAVDDPACYGWIFAFLGATQLPRPPIRLQVELEEEPAFQADVKWRSRLYPIQWLWLLVNIALESPVRSIWWNKLRKKGESKRARSQSVHRPAGEPHFQQDSNRRSYLSG